MKYLVILGVVIVLVLGVLIAIRMTNTHNRKKKEWRELTERAGLAEDTIRRICKEINVAKSAGMSVEPLILDAIVEDYELTLSNTNSKELAS